MVIEEESLKRFRLLPRKEFGVSHRLYHMELSLAYSRLRAMNFGQRHIVHSSLALSELVVCSSLLILCFQQENNVS